MMKNSESADRVPYRTYSFGCLRVSEADRTLRRDGAIVEITARAFDILLELLRNNGTVVSREELVAKVWAGVTVSDNNLSQQIKILREILGGDESGRPYIKTIARRGYLFAAEVSLDPEVPPPPGIGFPRVDAHSSAGHAWKGLSLIVGVLILFVIVLVVSWRSLPEPDLPDKALVLVVDFAGFESPLRVGLGRTILEQLRDRTKSFPAVEIVRVPRPISLAEGQGTAVAVGQRRGAKIVVWGEADRLGDDAIVTTRFEFLDANSKMPMKSESKTAPIPRHLLADFSIQERLASQAVWVVLVSLGVSHYIRKDYEAALNLFGEALKQPEPLADVLDPAAVHFYRGLCYQAQSDPLELAPEALPVLNRAIREFDAVLSVREQHSGSLWGRGLATVRRGRLLGHMGEHQRGIDDLRRAVADLDASLSTPREHVDFFTRRPDPWKVIWQRSLAHQYLAELLVESSKGHEAIRYHTLAEKGFTWLLTNAPKNIITERAFQFHSKRGLCRLARGRVQRQLGLHAEVIAAFSGAKSDLENAAKIDPALEGRLHEHLNAITKETASLASAP